MIRRPPRSTRTDTPFPTRRSSDLSDVLGGALVFAHRDQVFEAAMHRRHITGPVLRSEEHTSELQSLMRISYAVFCLKTKNHIFYHTTTDPQHILRYLVSL